MIGTPLHLWLVRYTSTMLFSALLAIVWPLSAAGQSSLTQDRLQADIAYGFLSRQMDVEAATGARFAQSYAATDCSLGGAPNAAYVYDQALALLAFLVRRTPDDRQRARAIADALVLAQRHDRTFKDGRLRNAYAAGRPVDPGRGWARLPGRWSPVQRLYLEDEYALGSDTGNMAWAAIALIQAQQVLAKGQEGPYLAAAVRLAEWIVAHTTAPDERGGFYGGLAGAEIAIGDPRGQARATWRSTEHNMDLAALFDHLAAVYTADPQKKYFWSRQKARAMKFVAAMQAGQSGAFLWSGTVEDSAAPNRKVLPVDIHAWGVLALPGADKQGRYTRALMWSLDHCRAVAPAHALDYNCNDGDGAWWEGTAQAAAALRFLKRDKQSAPIIAALKNAQIKQGDSAGALAAASKCGLTTGFYKTWDATGQTLPVRYSNAPHIGATAWFIFALHAANPFFLTPP